ncbi:MAG TPA: fused MFS/spermidine synthase [Archangium sp.]|nr:fused MFS/spermidine synthase [Archangium sp.]
MEESPPEEPKVVHKAPSPFGTVFVVDEGDERTLRFDHPDGNRQSAMLKSNPRAVLSSYVRVATAGLAFTEGRSRALVVGLGGGAFPLLLHRCLPRTVVDVVEINPVVVDVAQRFFGVRETERFHITVEDGAEFMAREGPSYDFIFLDAFSDKGIPDHLKKLAFFEDVLRRLSPGGAVVLNIALGIRERKKRLRDTFIQVFEECARLRGPSDSANLLLVGTPGPLPSEPVFRQQLWKLARELRFPELTRSVAKFEPHPTGPL